MVQRGVLTLAVLAAVIGGGSRVSAQNYPQASGYQPAPPMFDDADLNRNDGRMGPSADRNAMPAGQGPILSPDDPRYSRPTNAPIGVAGERGPGFIYPADATRAPNAPNATQAPPNASASVSPPGEVRAGGGANGSSVMMLPPEDQPETDAPKELPPNLRRQEVAFKTKEPAGTIIVDTANTHLYYVLRHGRAIRYGIRVGRDGFRWSGLQKITKKVEWPDWHPPAEMIERQPYLPRFMAGGPGNPLGARALYLGSTVYRIHGTNQPSTIGKTVSSGCFGMLNEDVEDLYDRVKVGTRVVVLPGNPNAPTVSAAPNGAQAPGAPNAVSLSAPTPPKPAGAAPASPSAPGVVPASPLPPFSR